MAEASEHRVKNDVPSADAWCPGPCPQEEQTQLRAAALAIRDDTERVTMQ